MPLHLPFNFPYFYNYRRPYVPNSNNMYYKNNNFENFNNQQQSVPKKNIEKNNSYVKEQKNSEDSNNDNRSETSDCFFEIFGLQLHFDDVLIMCILFFLYVEEVQDYELFLCLILLLIS